MCLGDLCNSLNDLDQFHYKEVIENIPDDFTTTTAAPCLATGQGSTDTVSVIPDLSQAAWLT